MREIIEAAWEDRSLLEQESTQSNIRQVIEQLDLGKLRVAEPTANGWQVNEWVKKAVVLYFPIQKMETLQAGPMEFHDKMPLKERLRSQGYTRCSACCSKTRRLYFLWSNFNAFLCQYWRICR